MADISKSPRKKKSSARLNENTPKQKTKRPDSSPSLNSSVSASELDVSLTSKKSTKKGKKRTSDAAGTDKSWEQAVKKARGTPDGRSGESSLASVGKGQSVNKGQKETNKPLKVIQSAAGKLKKLAGKGGSDADKKGVKRKHSGSSNEGDKKKNKDAELTWKERKRQRKMAKDNFELSNKAKAIWENIRKHDCTAERRQQLSGDLYELVKGQAKALIFAHDTSRVIQCLMKYGTQEHKEALFEELRESIVEMTKSKYAKFFVRKLLKYGNKSQRNYVFRCLYGNVRKLVRHKEAGDIVECAYNEFANAAQRAALVEEFYGPSFALFKTEEAKTLSQIMKSNPEKRDTILSNMREALSVLVDKTVCSYSIVHRVFLEYFTYGTDKHKADMIETVRESLIHMLHTRDGAHVAMMSIWNGTAKDRKVIIKSMKSYVAKICKEDYGHLVLLALFDVVDDTKLVSKAILDELFKSIDEIAQDQYGRKVILYLLSPRDSLHFRPDIVNVLTGGDNNPHSKKDVATRRRELLEHASGPLLKYMEEHSKEMLMNSSSLMTVLAIITHVTSDPTSAMKAVCKIAAEPFQAGSLENYHMVEHPAGHLVLKRLIVNDQQRIKDKKSVLFTEVLLDTLPEGSLKSWAACNRGCFILISMMELEKPEIVKRVLEQLGSIKPSLKKMDFKGAHILLEKLQA